MFKNKDRIFWIATANFILSLVLFAVTQEQLWMLLMVGSYLLRPTLASLGVARKLVDERQMSIHYRSGNIAFAVMILTCICMTLYYASKDDHTWEMFNMVVIIGIAAKALFNVIFVKNFREGASKIIIAVGLFCALFESFEIFDHFKLSNLVALAPGLAIAGIGWLARKYPRPVGAFLCVASVALMLAIIKMGKGSMLGEIITATLIGVPLMFAGLSLFIRGHSEVVSEEVQ